MRENATLRRLNRIQEALDEMKKLAAEDPDDQRTIKRVEHMRSTMDELWKEWLAGERIDGGSVPNG